MFSLLVKLFKSPLVQSTTLFLLLQTAPNLIPNSFKLSNSCLLNTSSLLSFCKLKVKLKISC